MAMKCRQDLEEAKDKVEQAQALLEEASELLRDVFQNNIYCPTLDGLLNDVTDLAGSTAEALEQLDADQISDEIESDE